MEFRAGVFFTRTCHAWLQSHHNVSTTEAEAGDTANTTTAVVASRGVVFNKPAARATSVLSFPPVQVKGSSARGTPANHV